MSIDFQTASFALENYHGSRPPMFVEGLLQTEITDANREQLSARWLCALCFMSRNELVSAVVPEEFQDLLVDAWRDQLSDQCLRGNSLCISNQPFSPCSIRAFSEALKGCQGLTRLYLVDATLSDEDMEVLAPAILENEVLQQLYFESNALSNTSAHALARALRGNTHIEKLSLRNNCIDDEGATALTALISERETQTEVVGKKMLVTHRSSALHELDLSYNQLSGQQTEDMVSHLQKSIAFQRLHVDNNYILDQASQRLKQAQYNAPGLEVRTEESKRGESLFSYMDWKV